MIGKQLFEVRQISDVLTGRAGLRSSRFAKDFAQLFRRDRAARRFCSTENRRHCSGNDRGCARRSVELFRVRRRVVGIAEAGIEISVARRHNLIAVTERIDSRAVVGEFQTLQMPRSRRRSGADDHTTRIALSEIKRAFVGRIVEVRVTIPAGGHAVDAQTYRGFQDVEDSLVVLDGNIFSVVGGMMLLDDEEIARREMRNGFIQSGGGRRRVVAVAGEVPAVPRRETSYAMPVVPVPSRLLRDLSPNSGAVIDTPVVRARPKCRVEFNVIRKPASFKIKTRMPAPVPPGTVHA